jgi:hypothetical protein
LDFQNYEGGKSERKGFIGGSVFLSKGGSIQISVKVFQAPQSQSTAAVFFPGVGSRQTRPVLLQL